MDPADSHARPVAATGLAFAAALVLLAGEPAAFGTPTFTTGAILRGVLFVLLAGGALLVAWAGPPAARPRLDARRGLLVLLPLAVFLLALLPTGRGIGAGEVARHAGGWLALALLPLALLRVWRDGRDAAGTWRLLLAGGVLAAFFVLVDAAAGGPAVGPFGRTGIAGPVLGALVAPALFLAPGRRRLLRYLPALLLVAACLATRSRTGVVALVLGTALALAIGAPSAVLRRRLRIAVALLGVALVVALGLAIRGGLPAAGARTTLDVRLGLHRTSLALIAERPLSGHGLGRYPTAALAQRDLEEARLEPGRRARHAHLDYLHVSVEGGVLAGLLLLCYAGGLLALGARGDDPSRRLRAAAGGVVATLAVAALGDGVLLDPAARLLLAVAAATLVLANPGSARARSGGVPGQAGLFVGALACLACSYGLTRDALADRELMRYRHAITPGVTLAEGRAAAQRHLRDGALAWRPDLPEALYRLAVHEAAEGRYVRARETYRRAFTADPGMTEARLDLAQVYALEGRGRDARAALEEARRRDPTRYDVRRRLMELALGPEPVPGDPPTPIDAVEVLRFLNEARLVAPDRFENRVDQARFARRRATSARDLAEAGARLRQALAQSPGSPEDPPAEILIESFRLAEAQDAASDLFHSTILLRALRKNPRPAGRFRAEAERFLDEGDRRRDDAVDAAGGDPAQLDMRAADRAYTAAAVRFTALLYAGRLDAEQVLAQARADREAGQTRRALARFRSLLAWTLPPQSGHEVTELRGPDALERLARQGDLLLEAASVAHGVDGPLSRFYRTQGQLRIGAELLEKGDTAEALRKFQSVVAAAPDVADGRYGLARCLARDGREDEAQAQLLEALTLQPRLRARALAEPDLETLRRRPAIKERLGIP